jgi:hypothetical protein
MKNEKITTSQARHHLPLLSNKKKMTMNICLSTSFGAQEHEEHEDDDKLGSSSSFVVKQHEEYNNEHLIVVVF